MCTIIYSFTTTALRLNLYRLSESLFGISALRDGSIDEESSNSIGDSSTHLLNQQLRLFFSLPLH